MKSTISNRNRLSPEQFNRIYGDICWLMYDTYETLFNIQLEYPINEYKKLAENHNCTIIEQTIKRRTLRLPVFTSKEDAENMKKELDCKLLLLELRR